MWTALRALEEQAVVKKRLAERFRRLGNMTSAEQLEERVGMLQEHAQRVRDLLLSGVGANEGGG